MKLPATPAMNRFTRPDRVQLRRLVCVAIVAASVVLTIFFSRAYDERLASLHEASVRSAWQTDAAPPGGSMTVAAVRARFNISGGGNAGDLAWQVASANELRASLSALELAAVKLREVKIARRGAGFAISAEQIP